MQLLQSGSEYFPALRTAIADARSTISLETYLFENDDSGRAVAEALAAAAQRGVQVQLLVDGYGAGELAPTLIDRLTRAGVSLRIYSPLATRWTLNPRHLRRLHRKLVCIDRRVAFVGGINLLDDRWDPNHGVLEHPRLDFAVRLEGPAVEAVAAAMLRLWRTAETGAAAWAERAQTWLAGEEGATTNVADGVLAMLVLRDNLIHRRAIERAYLKAIGRARREVLIANAYFFPGRRFRRALRAAARRGVQVRLLLQGRAEYPLPHLATQALYASLLADGVEIVEYHRSFLHAKVAVIDDWATVGSSNIDPFSLMLAHEANLVVLDPGFAAGLRTRLLAAMAEGGQAVEPAVYHRRSWLKRLKGWGATVLLRLGIRIAGVSDRY